MRIPGCPTAEHPEGRLARGARLDPRDTAARYEAERLESMRQALGVGAAIMTVLLPLNWLFQLAFRPSLAPTGLRWTVVLFALAALGVTTTRQRGRGAQALTWSLVLCGGLLLYNHNTMALDRGFASASWPGLPILLMAFPLLFPFTVREVGGLATLAWVGYLGAGFTNPLPYPAADALASATFFAQGTVIALAAAWLTEKLRRKEHAGTLALDAERGRSEALLANVLPGAVAERLKDGERTIADRYDQATVLFADVAGFTPLSQRLSPEELLDLLNDLFRRFDDLARTWGLEKIKTIGDAYMAAAGLPEPRPDHAEAVVGMALAMLEAVEALDAERGTSLSLRVGVHTGPVMAGVIGSSKFAYDLWGDTVNTASRMESHGVPGAVQVSEETATRVQGAFLLEDRGEIEVKGKGALRTFLVKGVREGPATLDV